MSNIPDIHDVTRISSACPSQWTGFTDDGGSVYIRFRWGSLAITVDDKLVFKLQISDPLDGYMSDEELHAALSFLRNLGE